MSIMITDDKQFIGELKAIGVRAKKWRNTGSFTPPADVNYRGELRIHTGGKPELIATDEGFKQAVVRVTQGRYADESFLIGMDETANFVCRLPSQAETVLEAHEILRPEGVLPHTIRQGEWFFVPVDEDNPKCACGLTPDEHLFGDKAFTSLDKVRLANRASGVTTHVAQTAFTHRGVIFVKGEVIDDRIGRHKPIDLGEKWHRAVPNTERALDQEPSRPRRFD